MIAALLAARRHGLKTHRPAACGILIALALGANPRPSLAGGPPPAGPWAPHPAPDAQPTSAPTPDAEVDVVIREAPPPRRIVSVEINPAALLVSRVSGNLELAPVDHHALIATPYYFFPQTSAFNRQNPADGMYDLYVPSQKFEGFGVELGYRYYTGEGGMRGFFAGPSLVLAWAKATAASQSTASFSDVGVAVDIGYQTLVADDWSVALGGGVQVVDVSKAIPQQQVPANVYVNSGVAPRLLFALGRAF